MKPIFDFLDYRAYLKDYYAERKSRQSFFSYRLFGSKIGVDASYLAKVLMKQRHLAENTLATVAEFCGLKGKEAEYFEAMAYFVKAKSLKQSKMYFEKMLALKSGTGQRLLADQYAYYAKWYYAAVRSMLEYQDFMDDYAGLAARLSPPITRKEAKEAVTLLAKLGLIQKDADGRWRMTGAALTTGPQWHSLAIESFQEETLRLSRESLRRHPKSRRDVSTVTMNINAADFADIRARIQEFRASIIQHVGEAQHPDRTYQLNIQFFPLSKIDAQAEP